MGGHCLPVDPFYLAWKAREYDFYTEFIELAGEDQPEHAVLLRGQDRAHAERRTASRCNGSRIVLLGVVVQARRRRPARVARAEDHEAAAASAAPTSPTTTRTCRSCPRRASSPTPLDEALEGADLRRDRDRASRGRLRRGRRRVAAGARLPRRHARHRVGRTWCGCSLTDRHDRRRRRPRLLGPEPRAQLRGARRMRAALVLRRAPRSARARCAPRSRRALHRPTSATCSRTPSSTRSCSRPTCRRTRALATRVLAAGKHCFVEKPLAQSVAGGRGGRGEAAAPRTAS